MPNNFETSWNDRAVGALNRNFAVDVTLERGGVGTTELFECRRNDVVHEVIGLDMGYPTHVTGRDFILPIASMLIADVAFVPRKGDRITDDGDVFEIVPIGELPPVEKQTVDEYLVHTQKVK